MYYAKRGGDIYLPGLFKRILMMEEKAKEIISTYLKTSAGQINASSAIDRGALGSSIMLHRMYARLSMEGIVVENYTGIKTYGDLLAKMKLLERETIAIVEEVEEDETEKRSLAASHHGHTALGIDIQEISSMPRVDDFRGDAFYTLNFNPTEIAYCILQSDPYASFAGLFAAKEAIVKADNIYANRNFKEILIEHLPGGKPVHSEYEITISHSGGFAIAAAIRVDLAAAKGLGVDGVPNIISPRLSGWPRILIILSLILSVIAIFIAFNHGIG